jgi:hypothetical protein
MYRKIHTYDLDGVLVDTSHRYRNLPDGRIDLDYWFANRTAEKIAKDKLLPLAKQYIADCINPRIYTVICTSRAYHPLDIEFIIGRLGAPDKLLMRPVGNMGRDDFIKFNQLRALFNLRQFQNLPRSLWEDNRQNISTLAELFTNTFHVPSHITG